MSDLTGSTISTTYNLLLTTAETVMGSGLQSIESGTGVPSALQLSTTTVKVAGTLHTVDGTPTFEHTTSNLQVDFISADASNILNFTNGEAGYDVLRTNAGLRFDTGGSEARMRIDSSGNVGIGGTAGNKLHVICDDDDGIRISAGTAAAHGDKNARILALNTAGTYWNDLELRASETRIYSDGTPTMTIDSSGNVGIGTAGSSITPNTDADNLVVENAGHGGISILTPDANNSDIVFGSPTDASGALVRWNYDASLMKVGTTDSGAVGELEFITGNNTPAMRIDSSGNVLCGGITGASGYGALETTTFTTEGQCVLNHTGSGNVIMMNLPDDDPEVAGALYTDGPTSAGVPKALMVSGGAA